MKFNKIAESPERKAGLKYIKSFELISQKLKDERGLRLTASSEFMYRAAASEPSINQNTLKRHLDRIFSIKDTKRRYLALNQYLQRDDVISTLRDFFLDVFKELDKNPANHDAVSQATINFFDVPEDKDPAEYVFNKIRSNILAIGKEGLTGGVTDPLVALKHKIVNYVQSVKRNQYQNQQVGLRSYLGIDKKIDEELKAYATELIQNGPSEEDLKEYALTLSNQGYDRDQILEIIKDKQKNGFDKDDLAKKIKEKRRELIDHINIMSYDAPVGGEDKEGQELQISGQDLDNDQRMQLIEYLTDKLADIISSAEYHLEMGASKSELEDDLTEFRNIYQHFETIDATPPTKYQQNAISVIKEIKKQIGQKAPAAKPLESPDMQQSVLENAGEGAVSPVQNTGFSGESSKEKLINYFLTNLNRDEKPFSTHNKREYLGYDEYADKYSQMRSQYRELIPHLAKFFNGIDIPGNIGGIQSHREISRLLGTMATNPDSPEGQSAKHIISKILETISLRELAKKYGIPVKTDQNTGKYSLLDDLRSESDENNRYTSDINEESALHYFRNLINEEPELITPEHRDYYNNNFDVNQLKTMLSLIQTGVAPAMAEKIREEQIGKDWGSLTDEELEFISNEVMNKAFNLHNRQMFGLHTPYRGKKVDESLQKTYLDRVLRNIRDKSSNIFPYVDEIANESGANLKKRIHNPGGKKGRPKSEIGELGKLKWDRKRNRLDDTLEGLDDDTTIAVISKELVRIASILDHNNYEQEAILLDEVVNELWNTMQN